MPYGAVQDRETKLTADAVRINGAADLTAADKSALLGIESSDASGLTALDTTIQGDTTLEEARTDCKKIVSGYHVYALFDPQVHLVIAADAISGANTKVSALATQLQQKLDGNTNPAVKAALADLAKHVAGSESAVTGVSSSVLALTPSGYPGNKPTLQTAQKSLTTARADLKQARTDIDTIRDALKTVATPSPAA